MFQFFSVCTGCSCSLVLSFSGVFHFYCVSAFCVFLYFCILHDFILILHSNSSNQPALGGALLSYWLHYQPMLTSSLTFSNFSAICFGYFPLAFKVMIRVLVKIRQNLQIDFSPCTLFFVGWNSWSMIHLIS